MKKLIFLFGLCMFLFSCEEEKLPEVTNPRFSVAYIQEVDSTGVVFAANIYDIGKQKVIEYGFYYGRSQLDLLENGEIVKQAGKPDKFFELKANYSLIKERQYFVAAYIKTSEGITLSEPTNFISQGSTGFIYERIEFPENAYYGDTIRMYARNLTQNISKYKVKINNQQTTVINVTTEYFEFTIPDGATFSKSQDVSFEIEVSEKKLTLYIPFNLREPEFLVDENRFLDFSTLFIIKGKYFRTSSIYVEIIDGQFPYFSDNITVTDSTIAFKPMAFFNTNSPKFNVGIRGQKYLVENNFKIKPTTFDPNQVININSVKRKSVILKGNNFNSFAPYLNPLKIEDNSIEYEVISVTENELEVLFYSNEINQNKTINVSIVNAGIESANKVQVNIIDPRTPIMDLNNGSVRVFRSIGDKIYYISNVKCFRRNLPKKITIINRYIKIAFKT
ncbi:hypothetical protein MM213_12870 [Belliella sp. R4-6]|uniref:DUF4397 domain-containing protein n=1 Tax=Belliella alkalica TaxID=1730871 RepID=A0ABS9VDX1_9BACT|nr:hypothetical protein [Belliella alkalica]MCH7414384.1 hypothetical protein [Belliella alkalica]